MTNTALIIDSDVQFVCSIKPLLETELGVNVVIAQNGDHGITSFYSKPFLFVLLDLTQPYHCGLRVLHKIREVCSHTKVVVVTSVSSEAHVIACANLNVQGFIKKPVEPAIVLNELKKIIGPLCASHLTGLFGPEYKDKVESLSIPVKRAIEYVWCNLDGDIKRVDIKKYAHISPDYLSRIFHKECGITFKEYVTLCRINASKELLLSRPALKISVIAKSVGMKEVNYFSRFFRKQTGLTPSEYREKHRRE